MRGLTCSRSAKRMRSFSGWSPRRFETRASEHAHEVLEDAARLGWRRSSVTRALVAVEALEEERVRPLLVRGDVAGDVAADRRVLDLDHLGAEVGELHRPERARAVLLDRDDANVGERACHEPRSAHRSASEHPARRGRHERVGARPEGRDVDLVAAARPLRVRRQVVAIAVPVAGDEGRREAARRRGSTCRSRRRARPARRRARRARAGRRGRGAGRRRGPSSAVAALGPHPGELRPHGELAHLRCAARRPPAPRRPRPRIARPRAATRAGRRGRHGAAAGAISRRHGDGPVRLRVGLVLERRDPRRCLALPQPLPVPAPRRRGTPSPPPRARSSPRAAGTPTGRARTARSARRRRTRPGRRGSARRATPRRPA